MTEPGEGERLAGGKRDPGFEQAPHTTHRKYHVASAKVIQLRPRSVAPSLIVERGKVDLMMLGHPPQQMMRTNAITPIGAVWDTLG